MKTFELIIAVAALLFSSCGRPEPVGEYFNIDTTDVVLADSKAGSTDILLSSGCVPEVAVGEESCDWLSAEITRRCLTLSYKENIAFEERIGRVRITAGSAVLSVSVTQPGREEEEPEPPVKDSWSVYDVYYENGKAAGIVFSVSEDGNSALVVSLDRSETLPWSYNGEVVIGTGDSDGAANTAMIKASEIAGDTPAITFCDAHGYGWYWPAINEMQALFEAYNGTTYDDATKKVPAEITEEERVARDKFDRLLTENGGTAMNLASDSENGDEYWTSTEQEFQGSTYGSCFRYGKPYASGGGDMMDKTKTGRRFVRCVKAVSIH